VVIAGTWRELILVMTGPLCIRGKRALATLMAAACVLGCAAATAAADGPPVAGALVKFEYRLSNVKPVGTPGVTYTGGVVGGEGGSVRVQSGVVQAVSFTNVLASLLGWNLVSVGNSSLTATVDDWRLVNGGTVTGTAAIPAGSSMTVTNLQTGYTTTVKNGAFSIPTGIGPAGALPPSAVNHFVKCHGRTHSCRAQINFAGGARHRTIVIQLTNTNLSLRSVRAVSRSKHPVYRLTGGHFVLGGSEYVVTLNAARSSPRRSHLILTFGDHRATGAAGTLVPPTVLTEFDYTVSNVGANSAIYPSVLYTGGVYYGLGSILGDQTLVIQAGAIIEAEFLGNAWVLFPSGGTPLTARLFDRRYVDSGTVSGSAGVAPGSSMTVTQSNTMQTTTLKNGDFSIPTGVEGLGAPPPPTGRRLIRCRGGAGSCQAGINYAGGARHRPIVIGLTSTNLSLRSVKAVSTSKHSSYSLTGGHFALGGSEYVATLNAARSSPPGSHLILTFRANP
jgi:hypothetical protein